MTKAQHNRTTTTMVFGAIVFITTVGAWLYGESHDIDTTILWAAAVPIIGALFIGQSMTATRTAAEQAASQTNGALESRIEGVVARVIGAQLSARDIVRTRQARGDISLDEQPRRVTEETHASS